MFLYWLHINELEFLILSNIIIIILQLLLYSKQIFIYPFHRVLEVLLIKNKFFLFLNPLISFILNSGKVNKTENLKLPFTSKLLRLPIGFLFSFSGSLFLFFWTLRLWNLFPINTFKIIWRTNLITILEWFDINVSLGMDGTSMLMVLLTTFIIPFSILTLIDRTQNEIMWMSLSLLILEFFLLIAFTTLNIFIFYIAFEAVLIPMFFLIGLAGSRPRKTRAAYYLFFYTFTGSLCMLIAMVGLYLITSTTDYDILVLINTILIGNFEKLFCFLFFLAFAIKTPIFPFHLWLPEAHVEAPTTGSIILAGLLLKLGTYGIYRYCIVLFPTAAYSFKGYIFALMILGMFLTSLVALRQSDMKRVVAYSSIVHMSYCLLGLFSFTDFGIKSAFLLMVAHGLVSSSLFALVGVLYDRYGTRFIPYYGGLAYVMPQTAILFFLAILGNISFPLSANFVAELGIFIGAMTLYNFPMILVTVGLILSTAYSVFLYNRLFFGALNTREIKVFKDINTIEFTVNYIFLLPVFFFGIYPIYLTNLIDLNISYFINYSANTKLLYNYDDSYFFSAKNWLQWWEHWK